MSIQIQTELINELREPKRYVVYMLNDDYTSWDFCLSIISSVFHKTLEEADKITKEIHTKGKGLCGIYTYEIAETKARIVEQQARKEGFPMKCSIEEK
jgi:ATP-dependent Clp protease adaptor protein ClpS